MFSRFQQAVSSQFELMKGHQLFRVKAYHRGLKSDSEVSFVDDPPKPDEELQLRFEVVKHVIGVKLAEKREAETAEEKRQLKQEIMAAIKAKQSEEPKDSSIEDLRSRLADL